MAFATDRDLPAIEPNVFRDLAWLGQRLISGVGDVSGTTLTLTSFDHDFVNANIDSGAVVLIAGVAHEVLSRTDATNTEVSKIRGSKADPAIPPDAGVGLEILVYTFAPQLEMVHREVLRLAGIEPADEQASPGKADIVNPEALIPLEAFGALHLAYSAGGALSGRDSHLASRAAMYMGLVGRERARVKVELDLDHDGVADTTRRLNVVQLLRA